MQLEPRVGGEPCPDSRVLWVERLSQTRCTSNSTGTSAAIFGEELLDFDRPVTAVHGADHLTVGHAEGANNVVTRSGRSRRRVTR